jgi:uridylate kinase
MDTMASNSFFSKGMTERRATRTKWMFLSEGSALILARGTGFFRTHAGATSTADHISSSAVVNVETP